MSPGVYVKGVAGEGQAVDNPPYNDMIRSDSSAVYEYASCMRVALWTQ
jgi:hypothetical protein